METKQEKRHQFYFQHVLCVTCMGPEGEKIIEWLKPLNFSYFSQAIGGKEKATENPEYLE